MSVTLKTVSDGINKMLQGMLKRERALEGYFNRTILAEYKNLQRKRWMTENVSEDAPQWAALDPLYVIRKLGKYASYPGMGRRKLIATGRLYQSVIGMGPDFHKVVTNRGVRLYTSVPYAMAVDRDRPFTEWSEKSERMIKRRVAQFVFKNIIHRSAETI